MTRFETITLSLPAHWIAPVLFGDLSALPHSEAVSFSKWLKDTIEDVGHGKLPTVGTIHDQTYFARYHDAAEYGVLACDCYDVDLLVEVVREEPNDPVQDYVAANKWTTAADIFGMEV